MSDDQTFSMWELGSGLPLEGARCHSTDASFTFNNEYSANAVVLDITWQPQEDPSAEAQHQLYSVGKNWEPLEEGTSVGHTSGKRSKFNDQTNIGRLIHSYVSARGGGDFAKGLPIVIAEGIEPEKAAMWIGLDVTLMTVRYPTQNKNPDGSVKEGSTMVIGEYHGRVGDAPAAASAPAQAAAPAAPASTPAAGAGATSDFAEVLGQALYRKLRKAAMDAKDHDEFMDVAFNIPETTEGDKDHVKAIERIILDPDPGSLFADARS